MEIFYSLLFLFYYDCVYLPCVLQTEYKLNEGIDFNVFCPFTYILINV